MQTPTITNLLNQTVSINSWIKVYSIDLVINSWKIMLASTSSLISIWCSCVRLKNSSLFTSFHCLVHSTLESMEQSSHPPMRGFEVPSPWKWQWQVPAMIFVGKLQTNDTLGFGNDSLTWVSIQRLLDYLRWQPNFKPWEWFPKKMTKVGKVG